MFFSSSSSSSTSSSRCTSLAPRAPPPPLEAPPLCLPLFRSRQKSRCRRIARRALREVAAAAKLAAAVAKKLPRPSQACGGGGGHVGLPPPGFSPPLDPYAASQSAQTGTGGRHKLRPSRGERLTNFRRERRPELHSPLCGSFGLASGAAGGDGNQRHLDPDGLHPPHPLPPLRLHCFPKFRKGGREFRLEASWYEFSCLYAP